MQALFRGEAYAYATIAAVRADGQSYTVDWDDGEAEDREQPLANIKPRTTTVLGL